MTATLASAHGFELKKSFHFDYRVVDTRDNRVSATIQMLPEKGTYIGQTYLQATPMQAPGLQEIWDLMRIELAKLANPK